MNIPTHRLAAAACALAAAVASPYAAAADTACGKPMTAAQIAQRVKDYQDIINVSSMHEYYHNALMHADELKYAWATKRDDITWTNNTDKYVGRASMNRFYIDGLKQMTKAGALWYHMLTTPVVQVAGDGKTAKAVFMSFGTVSGSMGPGPASSQWTQEKYGIDFVKEDGEWKIWHLRTYVDFYSDTQKTWLDPKSNIAAPQVQEKEGAGVKAEPGVSFEMAKPDVKGEFYEGYHVARVPKYLPVPPAPYCHFDDAQAY